MDVLIATQVMGWAYHPHNTHYVRPDGKNIYFVICGEFEPSSDIAAAWQVVEKVMSDWQWLELFRTASRWKVNFTGNESDYAIAETVPLAICRASLIAMLE